jgi:hypothetical protein
MKRIIFFGLALASLAGASRSFADVVVMDDGRRIRGELVSINRGLVLFDEVREGTTRKNRLRLERDQVVRIVLRDEAGRADDPGSGRGRRGAGSDDDVFDRDDRDDDRGPFGTDRDDDGRTRDDVDFGRERDDSRDEDVLYRGGDRGTRDDPARDDARARAVTVSARRPWTDTGLDVRTGEILSFSTEGTIQWGPGREDGPAGEINAPIDNRRPIPARPGGALIGRIGTSSSDVFFIGDDRGSFRVRNGGRLYLGVNDDTFTDNSGSFQVRISR